MDNEYISHADLMKFYKKATQFFIEYENAHNTRIVCENCHGSVTKSDGKYLCLSGCGHVMGFREPSRFLKKCKNCGKNSGDYWNGHFSNTS